MKPEDLEVLDDKVLIRLDPPQAFDGSILLSETGREKQSRKGTVIAVGPGRRSKKTGALVPNSTEVKPGDRVWGSYYLEIHGAHFDFEDGHYIFAKNDDIYLIEEPKEKP